MKLNRKWMLLVALVLSVAMATTGSTLAFLTDRDSEANVFTLGNVEIDLEENYDPDEELFPGETYPKEAWVKNIGLNDAYVWATVAVPAELEEALIITRSNEEKWVWNEEAKQEEIDGVMFNVYTVKYTDVLAPDAETPQFITSLGLNSAVDVDPEGNMHLIVNGEETESDLLWNVLEDGLDSVVHVSAYAIQTEGFDNFDAAYAAYYAQWGENGSEYEDPNAPDHTCWDGTVDASWYNDNDTEFVIMTAEQLAGFAKLVDEGNNFEGKTVKLGNDICLECYDDAGERVTFDPIGDKSAFEGTFDGQNHTIENLYQNGWALGYEWGAYGSVSLFGEVENATIKNLTMSGSESLVEGGDVAGITGSATGTCIFENITIEDSDIATYNNGCGGIIGWSGAGNYTFKNITIAEDVELTGLWGSFDSSIGGIVGQAEPGATYNFENVEINCRLNVFNDCTASYDYYNYRMCGMIMGRLEETTTIDGSNYPDTSKYNITCNNVTVNYGDWMNYHYCDPTPGYNNGRGMRVETGYSYDGLPADYDHSQCTTHHNELIPFDQIFGGDQLGVKGLKEYTGVTVNYPN